MAERYTAEQMAEAIRAARGILAVAIERWAQTTGGTSEARF